MLHKERRDYPGQPLLEVDSDPVKQFQLWLDSALSEELVDATAMTLATCGRDGQPSARTVLLKEVRDTDFLFYGGFDSHKGQQLEENNRAALLFYWREFSRQIRIEGSVQRVPTEWADEYFASRPRGSQIAAAISKQSQKINSREELDQAYADFEAANTGNIERPADWGGWMLTPSSFEFWQGRENRLHDRFAYQKANEGWAIARLQP